MNFDKKIFDSLYTKYRTNFIAIARSYVEDMAVAEDIVTDSFVSWWLRRNTLPKETDPRKYIVGTIKKQCLEHLRSLRIHSRACNNLRDANERMLAYHLASLENNTSENLHTEEIIGILRRQLEAMPLLMREIFIANRTEELSHREIAARFGISERRVKYELKKALETLKEAFKDYLPTYFILWTIDLLMKNIHIN
ncbi:MAG: RNA polymerase sigma-70 factor [Alistipes sp.]|nr:RNA polymerase sigma-70 factor [Alistipes sp.]